MNLFGENISELAVWKAFGEMERAMDGWAEDKWVMAKKYPDLYHVPTAMAHYEPIDKPRVRKQAMEYMEEVDTTKMSSAVRDTLHQLVHGPLFDVHDGGTDDHDWVWTPGEEPASDEHPGARIAGPLNLKKRSS